MGNRISFSEEILTIEEVAQKHRDIENSLRFYYTAPGLAQRDLKFIGYSLHDVRQEFDKRLFELGRDSAFGILGALEASFRVDYLVRCYERKKDDLSRTFRNLHKSKGSKVSLEKDVLEAWKQHMPESKPLQQFK